MQRALQFLRHRIAFDKAAFAIPVSCNTPKIWTVINIKCRLKTCVTRDVQRLNRRGLNLRIAKMRTRGHNSAGRADKIGINVIFTKSHIRAIFTVKDQWKLLFIPNAQQNQGRQTIRINFDPRCFNALSLKLFNDKAPHMFITNTRNHGAAQPKAGCPTGDIRRRTTNVFVERSHILKAPTNLCAI